MKYILLLSDCETDIIVFEKEFESLDDAIDMFDMMKGYTSVGYWLHLIDTSNNYRVYREYEKTKQDVINELKAKGFNTIGMEDE